jgi:hypothetical protein
MLQRKSLRRIQNNCWSLIGGKLRCWLRELLIERASIKAQSRGLTAWLTRISRRLRLELGLCGGRILGRKQQMRKNSREERQMSSTLKMRGESGRLGKRWGRKLETRRGPSRMRRRGLSGQRGAKKRRGLRPSRKREEQRGMLGGRLREKGKRRKSES